MGSSLLSMTGFGSAMRQKGAVTVEVELRSVNHRFLDLTMKIPRLYSSYEQELRSLVGQQVGRGRLEVFISRRSTDTSTLSINFNKDLFQKLSVIYLDAAGLGAKELPTSGALDILSRREVLDVVEDGANSDAEHGTLLEAVSAALTELNKMRAQEGAHLQKDLTSRLATLRGLRERMLELTIKTPLNFKEKLQQRLQKLAPEIVVDPMRFAAEVALLSDRIDTTEEFVRLESHFSQFEKTLAAGKGSGRRLDFIIQEMGREFNTISSKAQDAAVQHLVIDAKAEVERLKEQVQNVE